MNYRRLNRLGGYDYAQEGYYFVTVCVKERVEWFGNIEDGKMILNEYGKIVKQQWGWLVQHYPYLASDEYVIMPNHVHGIVVIERNGHDRSLRKIKSLSELIGAFKTTSSKIIHQAGCSDFQWQKSFYDHIIRNEQSLTQIREYIRHNPLKWAEDIENNTMVVGNGRDHSLQFINQQEEN